MGVHVRLASVGLRLCERLMYGLAAILLGWVAYQLAAAQWFQHAQGKRLDQMLRSTPHAAVTYDAGGAFRAVAARAAIQRGDPVGRLELERVGLAVILSEGVEESTLARAVGHLPGTALPGEAGNTVFAGHRDTFFRPLRRARVGDLLRITTPDGVFSYRIEARYIVPPDRVDLIASTGRPTLTLVTCYPFEYVGAAPLRYVLRAELRSDGATSASREFVQITGHRSAQVRIRGLETRLARP